MSVLAKSSPAVNDGLNDAIKQVINGIAPTWPLDRLIAVNPYWGRRGQAFEAVAADLARVAGSPMTLPLSDYREAWQRGEIELQDLRQALAELGSEWSPEQILMRLDDSDSEYSPLPLLSDSLDKTRDLQCKPAWCDTITHQVSQFCAAYFDRHQSDWRPDQDSSLFNSWRETLVHDHSVALLMHAPQIPLRAGQLTEQADEQITLALHQLSIPENEWAIYLQVLIMRVSGWAAWCAYRRWQAGLEGNDDRSLVELLAIRLGWEVLLDDGDRQPNSLWSSWRHDWQERIANFDQATLDLQLCWQRAQEIAYQRQLVHQLLAVPKESTVEKGSQDMHRPTGLPDVQAAFCIDVRSEVFRRHFEAQSATIQTIGFAGFFGLPISYAPLGTDARRPQLPGLLKAELHITDSAGDTGLDRDIKAARKRKLKRNSAWELFQNIPLSNFTMVESLGLGYLSGLVKRTLPGSAPNGPVDKLALKGRQAQKLRPVLDEASAGGVEGLANIARQVLEGMGLTRDFARIILLVGHGSLTSNNPHASGLDCGACCGQTGEVNARTLAGLLNTPQVREQLAETGIHIPDSTYFLAALHHTTTDEVELFDSGHLPGSHAKDLERMQLHLNSASAGTRRERADGLGLGELKDQPKKLLKALRRRAGDWAQTRPEWGLANNAAFIIAPRNRTRGIDLAGRSFLHDYNHHLDEDGSLLEQIMTAPMIVTHWINMQYYASTVDNRRFGSGNKTLHNVVGGSIGVFEGNGGDLRIGLPWQSLHDGKQWRHAPLRLTVIIEASREAIERVINCHETVKQLVKNRWLHLLRLDGDHLETYRAKRWHKWTCEEKATKI